VKTQLKLNDPPIARLNNIIDMGLDFSAMMRLFEKGAKKKLRARILSEIRRIFQAESKEQFNDIHTDFSNWGMANIMLAERRKNGQIIKSTAPASYGQIAKILDVVLKVAVYYCHLPDCERSRLISGWLNAAVDTKMMQFLNKCYSEDIKRWPTTIERVNSSEYRAIQGIVRKFIDEHHNGSISPVQFDDVYWEALNRK